MKDLIIGVMLGGAAAMAFLMTDCGCDFICATKKKLSGMCKCAEKELNCIKEDCKQAAQDISQAAKTV